MREEHECVNHEYNDGFADCATIDSMCAMCRRDADIERLSAELTQAKEQLADALTALDGFLDGQSKASSDLQIFKTKLTTVTEQHEEVCRKLLAANVRIEELDGEVKRLKQEAQQHRHCYKMWNLQIDTHCDLDEPTREEKHRRVDGKAKE